MVPSDDELEGFAKQLRDVDVVDLADYDDDFFDGLADSVMARIEAGSTEARAVPLRRRPTRQVALVALAAAAALALALFWGRSEPSPEPGTTPVAEGAQEADLDDPEAAGRQLGKDLLAESLATVDEEEEPAEASELLATSWSNGDLLTDEFEDDWFYGTTLRDELDDLTADELTSLAARL